ncbi:phosphoethanolamine--lipid A transferase [Shewanella sp. VB17]|uniref:phosphoethanolamine transferase n=1 Tax=Shewanella sp. VB17 TaxID=2739432 RepID=UPI001565C174|nr:phosphoethanolamine--lipid A transferase [Shewanella sp. VB17]NRD73733.1 phosphoethanolamine--lipid A transferase [Shewanella sp. VB17]
MLFHAKSLTVNQFTLLVTVYYVCIFNIPFFKLVKLGVEKQTETDVFFIATLPLFLVFLISFFFSCVSVKYLLKPIFILITLLSSGVFFAELQYGAVFDIEMIANIMQTNQAEALTYVNFSSLCYFMLTGIIPTVLIFKVNIVYKPVINEAIHKLVFMLIMLMGIGFIAFFYYPHYAAFNHHNDQLRRSIIPTYFMRSIMLYISQYYLQTPLPYLQQGLDAVNIRPVGNGKGNLIVLVVGETARAMNYEYYGYDRPTNTYTKKHGLTAFQDTSSCGTTTAVSVPCMFSNMTRIQYDARQSQAQDNVLDVLEHAGIQQIWFDNDSGCKGVCDRINHVMIARDSDPELCNGDYCYDQILLDKLDTAFVSIDNRDTLIVLHIIGSHGPTYYLRYPQEHQYFIPDCPRSDIQHCSAQALMNTYDNTILYTDYIIAGVIDRLKAQSAQFNTGMIYLSDHGESLAEKGLYLHGTPYAIAPDEQIKIPLLTWFSTSFSEENKLDQMCLSRKADLGGFSHDNLFDSLLGLMFIETIVYDRNLDIFDSCRGE